MVNTVANNASQLYTQASPGSGYLDVRILSCATSIGRHDASDDQRIGPSRRYLAALGLRPDVSACVAAQVEVIDRDRAEPHARGGAYRAGEALDDRVRF